MSLRNLTQNFPIGTCVHHRHLQNHPTYPQIVADNFNLIVPEFAMKCHVVCPKPHTYHFNPADTIVNFASQHHQQVRGTTLCWHQSFPQWLENLTNLELETALKDYIFAIVSRYQGKCYAWDVVNEAINDKGRMRPSPWRRVENFIPKCFRWAHQADPDAQLIYLDYRLQTYDRWHAVAKMIAELKADGVPIHGVGFQFYHSLYSALGIANLRLKGLVEQFHNLGVKVHLSEVSLPIYPPVQHLPQTSKDELQAFAYAQTLKAARECGCESFTVWGFHDPWDTTYVRPEDRKATPAIFDANLQPKAAYFALEEELGRLKTQPIPSAVGN